MFNFREDFNNLVVDNAEGFEFDWPKSVMHIQVDTIDPEKQSTIKVLHNNTGSLLLKCLFSEVTVDGAIVSLDEFKAWYREHISFNKAGSAASSTDQPSQSSQAAQDALIAANAIAAAQAANQYARLIPDAESSNLVTWDNPNDYTLVLLLGDGPTTITFGNFQSPQTLTIPDLGSRLFQFEGTGWFPVTSEVDLAPLQTQISALQEQLGQLDNVYSTPSLDVFTPINQQNVNINGPLLFGESTKLDAGWSHDVNTNSFLFAGSPRKVRVYVKCHQNIPGTVNSQRPAPMLFLDRTNIVNGTAVTEVVDCSATGYIRDTNDHENSSNGIVFPDMNPCLLYTSPSPRDQRGSRMPSSA